MRKLSSSNVHKAFRVSQLFPIFHRFFGKSPDYKKIVARSEIVVNKAYRFIVHDFFKVVC